MNSESGNKSAKAGTKVGEIGSGRQSKPELPTGSALLICALLAVCLSFHCILLLHEWLMPLKSLLCAE